MATQAITLDPSEVEIQQPQAPSSPKGLTLDPSEVEFAPAPKAAAPAAPAAPAPQTPPVGGVPDPGMKPESLLDALNPTRGMNVPKPLQAARNFEVGLIKKVASGPLQVAQGAKDYAASGAIQTSFNGKPLTPQQKALGYKGTSEMLGGAMQTGAVVGAPELAELGMLADSGSVAARVGLLKLVGGLEAGNLSSDAADAAAKKLGLSPEASDLLKTGAFFFPGFAGFMAARAGLTRGIQAQVGDTQATGFTAPGVKFGTTQGPQGTLTKLRVGGREVTYQRGDGAGIAPNAATYRTPAAPTLAAATTPAPQEIIQHQQVQDAVATMAAYQGQTEIAGKAAAGVPPPQPPPPPVPSGMDRGELTQQTVDQAASLIQTAPPEQRAQMAMQAHDKLADWMTKAGRFVGPDGKLQVVEDPKQASKLAQQLINDTVDAHAQKQQEAQQQAQQQAAATMPPAVADLLARRQVRVNRSAAAVPSAALPTPPAAPIPAPESKATVDAQLESLKVGTIQAVHLPEEQAYAPQPPAGMKKITVGGDVPGAGTWIYDPRQVRAATIKQAVKDGTHDQLLGHVQSRAEAAAAPEATVLEARTPDGTPVQDSAVTPDKVEEQKSLLEERHPGAEIVERKPEDVIAEREQANAEDVRQEQAALDAKEAGAEPSNDVEKREVPELDPDEVEIAPPSLTAQGLEAGKAATARTVPGFADKPVEEQDRLEAANMNNNSGQMDINARYMHEAYGPIVARQLVKASPETRAAFERLFGPEPASEGGSDEGNLSRSSTGSAGGVPAAEPGAASGVSAPAAPDGGDGQSAGPERELQPGSAGSVDEARGDDRVAGPPAKGDTVRFRDRAGEEREGKVAFADDRKARIKAEDGKEYTVGHDDIVRRDEPDDITYRNAGVSLADVAKAIPEPVRSAIAERAEYTRIARDVHAGLYDLDSMYQESEIRVLRILETMPGTASDQKAIYRYKEDPRLPINEKQQKLYSEYMQPFEAATRENLAYAEEHGFKAAAMGPDDSGFIKRIRKGGNRLIDKLAAGEEAKGSGGSSNRVSTKQPGSVKRRVMMAVESPIGERRVVSIKGGNVLAWDNKKPTKLGDLRTQDANKHIAAGDLWTDKNGKQWKIVQATTPEIKANTGLDYHENAAVSIMTGYLESERYRMAIEFLNEFKNKPEFAHIAFKPESLTDEAPKNWQQTKLMQMRGYYFEPRTAEVLDDYADRMAQGDLNALDAVNNFVVSVALANPVAHWPNIFWENVADKGVALFNPFQIPARARAAAKAYKAVMTRNSDFLEVLDQGASMRSARFESCRFAKALSDVMNDEIERDKDFGQKLWDAFAWDKEQTGIQRFAPARWLRAAGEFSGKMTWFAADMGRLQAVYERTAKGMPLKTALDDTARRFDDGRLPSRILDSRALAKLYKNRFLTAFAAFKLGRLKSFGNASLDALGASWKEAGKNQSGEAVDRFGRTKQDLMWHGVSYLAGIFLFQHFILPEVDKVLQKFTGNKDMHMRRAGQLAVPQAIDEVAHGERTPVDAMLSTVWQPNLLMQAGAELAFNRDLRTGRTIYNPGDSGRDIAGEIGSRLMQSLSSSEIQTGNRKGVGAGLLAAIGISEHQTGAMRVASLIAQSKSGGKAMTPEQSDAYKVRSQVADAVHSGKMEEADRILSKAHLTIQERRKIMRAAMADPLIMKVKNFDVSEMERVMKAATPDEQARLEPILRGKIRRAREAGHPGE